ncbi:MAG: Ku protein [Gemmatimonadota bacterium]|nr:Ku protein [Gemmatimonadota bacterium]MDH3424181.1 Ku protein [Gemmatimonadota bacterium]
MAARAIGTSTIAFGLVSLPVKIYSTGESSRKVSFNMIWKERGVRVRQQYIDPADGAVVPKEEIVKGYEFAKDQYVLFTPEELEVVEAPKSDEIEIVSFVPADSVGRLYFNKAYYLGPDKGGARAYRLLGAALRQTDRVAIAKHATRGKQYIVMIRPHDEGLLMEQLYYADEIRSFEEVPLEEGEVNDAELALAIQLVDQAASEAFDPAQFQDEVRARTLELIEQKIQGQEITAAPVEESKTKIIDLMAALKASIEADEDERKPATRAGKKTKGAEKPAATKRSTQKKAASG